MDHLDVFHRAAAGRDLVTRARSFAWFAFAVPLAFYVASLSQSCALWDTGEMQVVSWILGISHPTGFPAFVILGFVVSHLVPFGSPAWRIGLFSALAMAGACATLALFLREFAVPRWAAILAAWLFAVGQVAWTRGSRAEVQALATFFATLALLFAVRWIRTRAPRDTIVAAMAWGLALATHPVAVFLAPGLLCVALIGRRALTLRRCGAIVAAAVAPLALYAYLPLRSAYVYAVRRDPTLALGLPPGRPFWDTHHPASGIRAYLDDAPTHVGGGIAGVFAPDRWGPDVHAYGASLLGEYGIVPVVLGLVGLLLGVRDRPLLWIALVVSAGLTVPFILNFPEADTERYFLVSFWLFAAAIGIGTHRCAIAYARNRFVGNLLAGAVLAASVAWIAISNANILQQRNDTAGDDFIRRVAAVTPANAVIVSEWTYVTPLAYAAFATHDFGDRIPVTGWPTDYATLYRTWLKTRPVFVHVLKQPLLLPAEFGVTATLVDPQTNLYALAPRASPRP